MMIFDNIFLPVMIVVSALFVAINVMTYMLANVFDALYLHPPLEQDREIISGPKKKIKVDVWISQAANLADIETTLECLNKLHNVVGEVVVFSRNTRKTQHYLRGIKRDYPRLKIKIVETPSLVTTKRSYVLKIEAGMAITPETLDSGTQLLARHNDLHVVYASLTMPENRTIAQLLNQYLYILGRSEWKAMKLLRPNNYFPVGLYRSKYLLNSLSFPRRTQITCQDFKVLMPPRPNLLSIFSSEDSANRSKLNVFWSSVLTWPLTFIYALNIISLPVLITYLSYLALSLHEPTMLMLTWGLLSIFLLLSIWGDEAGPFSRRLRLSLMIPASFPLFYLLILANLFNFTRPLIWPEFMGPEYLRPDRG